MEMDDDTRQLWETYRRKKTVEIRNRLAEH